ncbi:hypothetical protein llap_19010 [Limosa lapponica baueri]|uniref:RUN domain-containing protein n=1 Tax=Limosa lapponica baueri TaxID=1758121 RepID=A0A2I0TA59_LIMLA|nr:hypothetical protein llap_19010 [Limosa lapponica baueri]
MMCCGSACRQPEQINVAYSAEITSRLQSYFAACEDETPAIRNHDKVLQRLCEHLDHALLYGLQDLSSGYWVLVVHFTRREAVKQIEVLQHVATNLGRSRAWLYLALNENSLESYLRLFQENLSLLHKYYVKNALVCSHDHLTLFLTLVSGLEFIRFDLDLDAPYLDLAPYMPDYYKPQYLLDFEDRLPSSLHGSDSLSLNSFNSVTSTNLEWDDSAIAPSSEDYDFGDVFPAMQTMPSRDWEDGDLTDTLSCPRSTASEANGSKASVKSPTQRYNPFNEEKADVPSSTETTPVHAASQEKAEATPEGTDQSESCTELEVIRFFLVSLKSAMIKGCREPPYPSILTDATMEKLALAKFVAQESKCEACDVVVRFYGLVHWEDPMDEALGPANSSYSSTENAVTKDGVLHYKAGTSYLGKEQWKTCFVVLSSRGEGRLEGLWDRGQFVQSLEPS